MNSKRNKDKKIQDIQNYAFINIESCLYSLLLNFQFKAHFLDTPLPFPKNHAQMHLIFTPALKMAMLLQIYIMCIVNKGIASLTLKVLNNNNNNNKTTKTTTEQFFRPLLLRCLRSKSIIKHEEKISTNFQFSGIQRLSNWPRQMIT